MFGKKSNATLAIDLGIDAVRIVEVLTKRGQPTLSFFAEQAMKDGPNDTLAERHLTALGQLASTHKLSRRKIVAALPSSMVLTRTLQLDRTKPGGPEEQIVKTLQNTLPFDAKDLAFDYWPISPLDTGRTSDVMVVATQASVIQNYLDGFEKLSFDCAHLDVSPCAIASLIHRTAENPDAVVGTIALTRNVGFFAIAEKGRVLFWRPFDFNSRSGGSGIQANLDRVGDEISKCVSHMVGAVHVDSLSEMLVFGHGSDDTVVTEYLKNRFHLNVRNPSPFDALTPGGKSAGAVEDAKSATHYCTAVGLAVQEFAGATANG